MNMDGYVVQELLPTSRESLDIHKIINKIPTIIYFDTLGFTNDSFFMNLIGNKGLQRKYCMQDANILSLLLLAYRVSDCTP